MTNLACTVGFAFVVIVSWVLSGCGEINPGEEGTLGQLSYTTYESTIQPILDSRGCSSSGCHYRDKSDPNTGGPGGSLRLFDCSGNSCTQDELTANYDSAYGMANLAIPASSKLLTKPLADGVQHLGDDIFLSTADPDYQALLGWIQTPSSTP